MPEYHADRRWADRFIPQLKQIVADLLVTPAPEAEDLQRNTDLIVFRVETLRVACRVRRFKYLVEYPFDFTVRSGRPNGADTELAKILAGYGDYLVYAFASEDEQRLAAWRTIDLCQFRLWFHRQSIQGKGMPGIALKNGDGSSAFRAFDVRKMPVGVVASEFGFSLPRRSQPANSQPPGLSDQAAVALLREDW